LLIKRIEKSGGIIPGNP